MPQQKPMKNFTYILLLISCNLFAQKNAFELSLSPIHDKNLNLELNSIGLSDPVYGVPSIDNRLGGLMCLSYERKNNSPFSLIMGVRNIFRKINYIYHYRVYGDFFQNTLELPIGMRYTQKIND
jgi:hypothetical protein